MTPLFEKLALIVAELEDQVVRLRDEVIKLRRDLDDTRDILRGCACFGTDDGEDKP